MATSIQLTRPNDFHHHLRDGDMLKYTVPHCFNNFKNVVVMPNLVPPITTIQSALKYRERILSNLDSDGLIKDANPLIKDANPLIKDANPLMTLYLSKEIPLEDLRNFKNVKEMIGIKFYPKNATTNSQYGIEDVNDFFSIFKVMEEEDIPLMIHGETIKPNVDIFKKEKVFIKEELTKILENFPKLRIILEHITTKEAVDFVEKHNIHATITPHHLLLDRNDIFKNGINPHLYCLPILKKSKDREALVKAATSGKSNFFLGTDSAPHIEKNKLSSCGCAGVFNSLVANEIVIQIFEDNNSLHNLDNFLSLNGSRFYKLCINKEKITYIKESWKVDDKIGDIVPLMCGKELNWKKLK